MFATIYVDEGIADHPRTAAVLARHAQADVVPCRSWSEVFNRKAQNFRLQKRRPALILARKQGRLVYPAPAGYGIGAAGNFYFSHMLNCIFDCRYCFLQGMYRSANFVLFVNFEDFAEAIRRHTLRSTDSPVHFFSGYDCDSLALDPLTGFTAHFLPLFRELPGALLELRTKSTQIRCLIEREPQSNCVIAFSFTPLPVSRSLEHGVPSAQRRLDAMLRLQAAGWPVALRFDPLIWSAGYREAYRELFDLILDRVDIDRLHSVSLGAFRLPAAYFERMLRLFPREKLFASPLQETRGMREYPESMKSAILEYCRGILGERVPPAKLFLCDPV